MEKQQYRGAYFLLYSDKPLPLILFSAFTSTSRSQRLNKHWIQKWKLY